jgi:YfiH family protein
MGASTATVLRSPLLEAAGLRHGFTTLGAGDFSAAALETAEGRAALAGLGRQVGFDPELLVTAEQVHGATLAVVHRCERCGPGNRVPHTDALLTEEPWPLLITVADCFPVVLYAPEERVLALVHCGWRGTVAGILPRAVRRLVKESGQGPSAILAAIGPGICARCYEVGDDVVQAAFAAGLGTQVGGDAGARRFFDIAGALRLQLEECGLLPERIDSLDRCTFEDPELPSYRRDRTAVRAAAVAMPSVEGA